MSGKSRQTRLATDIARALGSENARSASTLTSRYLLMAGVAAAIMQTQPAGAVSLGELKVQSGVGQPFVASTTARIGPGESLSSACISAPAGGKDLSSPAGLQVTAQSANTPGSYPVQVRSTQPLYEPMYEIRLQIKCPGDVALSKNYIVMLNLPMQAPVETTSLTAENSASPTTATTLPRSAVKQSQPPRRGTVNGNTSKSLAPKRGKIAAGKAYRVRSGDTLSTIAQRIDGRPADTIWRVSNMLYSANPGAFIRGDRNMIKLGWVLNIPSIAEMESRELSATQNSSANEAQVNEPPVAVANAQLNTALGRPEEEVVDNVKLLSEIREANLAAISVNEDGIGSNQTVINSAKASPFADEAMKTGSEAIAAAGPATPAIQEAVKDTLPEVAAPENETSINPLLAVFAGVAMGMLLALLILGRKIITPLLEGRARRQAAYAPKPAPVKASARKQVFTTMEVGSKPAATTYGGSGIDVEISDLEAEDSTAEPILSEATSAAPASDDAHEDLPQIPRVNLHKQTDNLHSAAALEGTGTMHSLFDENHLLHNVEENAVEENSAASFGGDTAELPETEQSKFSDAESENLDTINSSLQLGSGDEEMSATLVEALGLLEQDYEDELTASQILKKQEVEEALASAKKG